MIDRAEHPFIIERLERGALINPRSFLVKDQIDTSYKCVSKVSVFVLTLEKLHEVMKRRSDLLSVVQQEEHNVLSMKSEIALDYIMHINHADVDRWEGQARRNGHRVRLKNAILQTWHDIKKSNSGVGLQSSIDRLLAKQRQRKKGGLDQVKREKERAEEAARAETKRQRL